jgi:small subunit ribosomal protein S13
VARYVGVEIPDDKKLKIGLTNIYGIGRARAMDILERAKIDPDKELKDITGEEESRLRSLLDELQLEGELRQDVRRNVKRLKDINCYRGIRHKKGLPVRGQRTRCNAHTRKGKSLPVGGLKRKLEKT